MTEPSARGRLLADFAEDAVSLSPAEFAEQHGTSFLVLQGDRDKLRAAMKPVNTEISIPDNAAPSGPLSLDFIVFSIRRGPRSQFPDFVSVGRTENNDIVVDDVSVSKFQAFIRIVDGVPTLLDADSSNGTFVDDQRLPGRRGDPVPLKVGSRVRFGQIEFSYLPAKMSRSLCSD